MTTDRQTLDAEFAALMADLRREAPAQDRRAAIEEMQAFLLRAKSLPPLDFARMKEQARMIIASVELELTTDDFTRNIRAAIAASAESGLDDLFARQEAQMRAFMDLMGHDPDEPARAPDAQADALFRAVDTGDAAAVRDAVAETDLNGFYGDLPRTLLYHAVSVVDASPAMAHLLLDLGADPRIGRADGCTPLHGMGFAPFHDATQVEVTALAKRLVASGADPDTVTGTQDRSPAALAIDEWNPKVLRALIEAGARLECAMFDAAAPSPEVVSVLLDAGLDPHLADIAGTTAADRLRAEIERNDAQIAGIRALGRTPEAGATRTGRELRASLALMEAVPPRQRRRMN